MVERLKRIAESGPWQTVTMCLYCLSLILIVAGFAYIAISWRSLPDVLGCHFSGSGEFDIFWNKKVAFLHPVIAESLLFLFFSFLSFASMRVKPGKKLTARGHASIANAVSLFCAVLSLSWSVFFAVWINCVITQQPMPVICPQIITIFDFIAFGALVVFMIIMSVRYGSKKTGRDVN